MSQRTDATAADFLTKRITSPANETIKAIGRLRIRKHRKRTGEFVAEGLRTIIEAAELGIPIRTLVFSDEAREQRGLDRVIESCLARGGKCFAVARRVLEKLSGRDNPQTVIATFDQRWERLGNLSVADDFCWIVLEAIKDPGNLGTILRTSDAVGAAGVILLDNACDPYSLEAVRASMGSIFSQRIVRTTGTEFLEWRKNQPAQMVGTALHAATDYAAITYRRPLLLVMGTEQSGLSQLVANSCDALVKIPMRGRADSLNLAVATSVMLYAALQADLAGANQPKSS